MSAARKASLDAAETLSMLLAARGIALENVLALRLTLNRQDRSADFQTMGDVVREGVDGLYARMQDGRRFGDEAKVLIFIAETAGTARLAAFRRFVSRRKGLVPGDIVYDYDAAHLLHSFIARARCPIFYDGFDEAGVEDLIGTLVLRWPKPMMHGLLKASDPRLRLRPMP